MDSCQAQFSSRETGQTQEDIDKFVYSLNELRAFLEQTTGAVQSQGKKLITIVTGSAPRGTPKKAVSMDNYNPQLSSLTGRQQRGGSCTPDRLAEETDGDPQKDTCDDIVVSGIRKTTRSGSYNPQTELLHKDQNADNFFTLPHRPKTPNPSKLLVNPKRSRPGMKTAVSVPSLVHIDIEGQEIIEDLLQDLTKRMSELETLYEGRKNRLKKWEEVIRFREAAPEVSVWVEKEGDRFSEGKCNIGRSIEEVSQSRNVLSRPCVCVCIYVCGEVVSGCVVCVRVIVT